MIVAQAIISHGVDVNEINKMNVTALMIAYEEGNKDTINMHLNAGVDPYITDGKGDTYIHYADNEECSEGVLKTIIDHRTDVNATSKQTETALMCTCEKGNVDIINVLLNAGANPNIADANDSTCLRHATRNDCCTEVLQAIIRHGIDVNATNKKNISPLMIVCVKGNKDAINVLFNAGAVC